MQRAALLNRTKASQQRRYVNIPTIGIIQIIVNILIIWIIHIVLNIHIIVFVSIFHFPFSYTIREQTTNYVNDYVATKSGLHSSKPIKTALGIQGDEDKSFLQMYVPLT